MAHLKYQILAKKLKYYEKENIFIFNYYIIFYKL